MSASVQPPADADDLDPELARRIASLGRVFIERTAVELATLYTRIEQAQSANGDEPLMHVARIAHGIHGAGASLGFDEVGECAGAIALAIKRQRAAGVPHGADFFEGLYALVHRLDVALLSAMSTSRRAGS
jgi:Hpt domain